MSGFFDGLTPEQQKAALTCRGEESHGNPKFLRRTQVVKHPCAGMTPAQRRDFELIATGDRPQGGFKTIKALKARGVIEDAPPKILGRDRFGNIAIPQYNVPLPVHIQWCEWCGEQPVPTDTGSVT